MSSNTNTSPGPLVTAVATVLGLILGGHIAWDVYQHGVAVMTTAAAGTGVFAAVYTGVLHLAHREG